MKQNIHVWHVEIVNPVPVPATDRAYRLELVSSPTPEFARYLYLTVGADWLWYMRLSWNRWQWQSRMENPDVELWVAFVEGCPAGYFELERQPGDSTEICYFGLTPESIGRGLGRTLLEDAIARATAIGGKRVWLHTCSLDHENALANYQARGFEVFKEEDVIDDVPRSIDALTGIIS